MPVPPPGVYRVTVTMLAPPGFSWTEDVVVNPEFPSVSIGGVLLPFVPLPIAPEGPTTGVYCDGAGAGGVYLDGVRIADVTCVPLPPPGP